MADVTRYLDDLVRRLSGRPERVTHLKARTLLKQFGYATRNRHAVAAIRQALRERGLRTTLSARQPSSLDGRVDVRLTGHAPSQPGESNGALRPRQEPKAQVARDGPPVAVQPSGPAIVDQQGWASDADRTAVAERGLAATVMVVCGDGHGAGVLVHEDGLVVTARHVVRDRDGYARHVEVRLRDGRRAVGTVVRGHTHLDFALMWLDRTGPFASVPLGDATSLRAAESVLAIGHPEVFRNTVSGGMISNPRAVYGGVEYLQTDAALDQGNSGGPLLNTAGELVGIAAWEWGTLDSGKFALPVEYFADAVAELVSAGRRRCLASWSCLSCGHLHLQAPPVRGCCRVCGSMRLARGA